MRWKDRISQNVKLLIDIDTARDLIKNKYDKALQEGFPATAARRKVMKEVSQLMIKKGVPSFEATHFLHVSEVFPYSGCGCCLHRQYNRQEVGFSLDTEENADNW